MHSSTLKFACTFLALFSILILGMPSVTGTLHAQGATGGVAGGGGTTPTTPPPTPPLLATTSPLISILSMRLVMDAAIILMDAVEISASPPAAAPNSRQ